MYGFCSKCQHFYPVKECKDRCPEDNIPLRTSARRKRNNGDKGI
jgi:hypothetical protein